MEVWSNYILRDIQHGYTPFEKLFLERLTVLYQLYVSVSEMATQINSQLQEKGDAYVAISPALLRKQLNAKFIHQVCGMFEILWPFCQLLILLIYLTINYC